jgi:hypothetical protein
MDKVGKLDEIKNPEIYFLMPRWLVYRSRKTTWDLQYKTFLFGTGASDEINVSIINKRISNFFLNMNFLYTIGFRFLKFGFLGPIVVLDLFWNHVYWFWFKAFNYYRFCFYFYFKLYRWFFASFWQVSFSGFWFSVFRLLATKQTTHNTAPLIV